MAFKSSFHAGLRADERDGVDDGDVMEQAEELLPVGEGTRMFNGDEKIPTNGEEALTDDGEEVLTVGEEAHTKSKGSLATGEGVRNTHSEVAACRWKFHEKNNYKSDKVVHIVVSPFLSECKILTANFPDCLAMALKLSKRKSTNKKKELVRSVKN